MEQEKVLQDIMTIKSYMEEGRRSFKENGFYFIYWGLVIPINTAISYLLGHMGLGHWVGWFWMISCVLHGGITAFIGSAKARKNGERSTNELMIGKLWIAYLLIFPIFFLQQLSLEQFNLPILLSCICLLLALSTWVHLWLIRMKWLLWMPLGWLISAAVILFLPVNLVSLFMAAATLVLSFIPGLLLKRKE